VKNISLKIEKKDENKRLDLVVVLNNNLLSRSNLKRLINIGKVRVNGVVEFRPHLKMKEGDLIEIDEIKETNNSFNLIPQDIDFETIYEDSDLLVVNKPSGMVIHPSQGNLGGTLMNAVAFKYKSMEGVGDRIRSGLIHRIDKDTSGIVLIGKTNKGLWYYSKLFADREIEKTYIAIVAGNIKNKFENGDLKISNYLGRNPSARKKMTEISFENGGRPAETNFSFLNNITINNKICSIVIAKPKTGRTHQIRVHLSNLGYPILGDVIYGKNNKFSRLMLHAWKIKLCLLNGKVTEFESKLPKEFDI